MTIPDLIVLTLGRVREGFYAGRSREFKRDERALTKAIARYGFECERRGWDFNALKIAAEIAGLLHRIRESGAEIRYLPIYLEGAVDRHIRERAEELSAAARTIAPRVRALLGKVRAAEVREPSDVEVLSTLYRALRAQKRSAKSRARPAQQPSLL